MRWQSVVKRGQLLSVESVDARTTIASEDRSADGPRVCVLYESEAEREELCRRLREVGLDELSWELVDMRPVQGPTCGLERVRLSLARAAGAVGTGCLAVLAVLDSHRALVAALAVPSIAVPLVLRLVWGRKQPEIA